MQLSWSRAWYVAVRLVVKESHRAPFTCGLWAGDGGPAAGGAAGHCFSRAVRVMGILWGSVTPRVWWYLSNANIESSTGP
jgi:hypothetical protein